MIGEKIRHIRAKSGLSISELSRQSGVAITTIHNIETGISKNPSWYAICKIAKVLNVDLNTLAKQ